MGNIHALMIIVLMPIIIHMRIQQDVQALANNILIIMGSILGLVIMAIGIITNIASELGEFKNYCLMSNNFF